MLHLGFSTKVLESDVLMRFDTFGMFSVFIYAHIFFCITLSFPEIPKA